MLPLPLSVTNAASAFVRAKHALRCVRFRPKEDPVFVQIAMLRSETTSFA